MHGVIVAYPRPTFCARYADSFHRRWDDLGDPRLDQATVVRLVDGMTTVTDEVSYDDLAARRDALVAAVVGATHPRLRTFSTDVQASHMGAEQPR